MIWHFVEVWVLMLVAFAIGCPLGALAYRLIAGSPLAELQGSFADVVGDRIDDIKDRFGIGPVWRPEHRRVAGRAAADDMGGRGGLRIGRSAGPALLPAPGGSLALADRAVQRETGEADDGIDESLPAIAYDEPDAIDVEEVWLARPVGLAAPRNGVPDDLQRIRGIGRRIERRLNGFGIYHFGQIAAWTPAEMHWVAQQLAFPERIEWDDWVGQAVILAAGGDTGFVKSADRRRRARRLKALEAGLAQAEEEEAAAGDDADEAAMADHEAGEASWDEPRDEDAEAAASGAGDEPAGAEDEDRQAGEPAGGEPEATDDREIGEAPLADGEAVGVEPEAGEAAGEAARKDGGSAGADSDADEKPA